MFPAGGPADGPQASFSASVSGTTASFDASASGPDAARYDWDFGDGTMLFDGGPTPTHAYTGHGPFIVTLTVTDATGCGPSGVWIGHQFLCTGLRARTRQVVTVQPTSAADCRHGGWRSFGFKNQGDCVSFVATGGKNPPSRS